MTTTALPTASSTPVRRSSSALRWLPAVAAVAGGLGVLIRFDTPLPVAAAYLVAWLLLVTVPGTLLWRMVRRTTESTVEDVAIGSAVGLAVQVLLAAVLATVGWAAWTPVSALVVVAVALLPSSRHVWRRRAVRPWSTSGSWTAAVAVVVAFLWVGTSSFARNLVRYLDLGGTGARGVPDAGYVDMPYHQSLTAGIQTFRPLVYPYLFDEPLHYHFFAYEHLAVLARVAGADLTWVVYRLHTLPLVALGVVLVGVLAARVARRSSAGPLGVVLAVLTSATSLVGWAPDAFFSPGMLSFSTFRSPTHTFGVCLLVAALVLAVVTFRDTDRRSRVAVTALFAVVALAAGGSKSTLLPVLACGLALAAVVAALRRRRVWRSAAVLCGICVAAFALVALLVIGTSTDRVAVDPGALLDVLPLGVGPGAGGQLVALVAATCAWGTAGAGGLLLLLRRPTRADPALWLLVGVAVAGFCAALLTFANGVSQLYFLYGAWPVLPALSAWGLSTWTARSVPRTRAAVIGAALGVTAVLVARDLSTTPPAEPTGSGRELLAILAPGAVALAATVALAVGVAVAWRGGAGRRGVALVAGVAVLVGASVTDRGVEVVEAVRALGSSPVLQAEGIAVPPGVADAAVALRDLSDPSDVVATNAHCYGTPPSCDARHFVVSALTERRVLVEGWAYPDGGERGEEWSLRGPYWDQERLADNDVVFRAPSEAAVQHLADEYGVRWLFVDRTVERESPDLARYAELVVENDEAAVYRLG